MKLTFNKYERAKIRRAARSMRIKLLNNLPICIPPDKDNEEYRKKLFGIANSWFDRSVTNRQMYCLYIAHKEDEEIRTALALKL